MMCRTSGLGRNALSFSPIKFLVGILAAALAFSAVGAHGRVGGWEQGVQTPMASGSPARPARDARAPRDFFPPWEGAGVYVFGPLRIDLNRLREQFNPMAMHRLVDCSTEQLFCLTSRRHDKIGSVMAFVGPRRCSDFKVGDSWSNEDVRTEVLARIRTVQPPLEHHFRRSDIVYYLGDGTNPAIVYEYWAGEGVVAVYHGLSSRPDLVNDVRQGLDPRSLPVPYRMSLMTFDRFAPCRFR